jgi:hypothetical protein
LNGYILVRVSKLASDAPGKPGLHWFFVFKFMDKIFKMQQFFPPFALPLPSGNS